MTIPGKLALKQFRNIEFIRRYLMHVLPSGFQKIRYYGFLNNRYKNRNLKLIFTIQGRQRFKPRYSNLSMAELLKAVLPRFLAISNVAIDPIQKDMMFLRLLLLS